MRSTLFLNPPSFEGFDGGAGSRYQARREVRSFYYPVWLAQPAALVPGSRLVDAPARGLSLDDVLPMVDDRDLAVLHTSAPSFRADVQVAAALKARKPGLMVGLVGPHVAVSPEACLEAAPAVDFVAGEEFDFTCAEIAQGRDLVEVAGIHHRVDGAVVATPRRPVLETMDLLPSVLDVYRRDLVIEDYYNGYLMHPYVSVHTGRGCKSRCSFCLWPQTIGGHRYRTRSVDNVLAEMARVPALFPQVKEIFFDDDTFTDDLPRAVEIARGMGRIGLPWSCNAKGNVPFEVLKTMRENGLRLLVVGYESGNQQILHNIKKGMLIDRARRFTQDCHALGIKIHGTFVVGLPGETAETIRETMRFAREMNPYTIQVSVAAAYPGTSLHREAVENGWLREAQAEGLVDERGLQVSSLTYPHLSHEEIFAAAAEFYKRFYLRPSKIVEIMSDMVRDRHELMRRLREGVEFFRFLAARKDA